MVAKETRLIAAVLLCSCYTEAGGCSGVSSRFQYDSSWLQGCCYLGCYENSAGCCQWAVMGSQAFTIKGHITQYSYTIILKLITCFILRSNWPNADQIPPYVPQFYDGWQPPAPVPPQPGPISHPLSRSNSQKFPAKNDIQQQPGQVPER